ncbi:MAG TPA: hypothetical protein VHE35_00805, partial [Kofleriaceae bacterium]|nr:hypothetical protein [Kofleriaceae bacterium]
MSEAEQPGAALLAVDGLLALVAGGAEVELDDGTRIEVVGDVGALPAGSPVRLIGRWVDPAAARRLEVADVHLRKPIGAAAIERFLGSGFFAGVGPADARAVVGRFGAETLRVLETAPDRIGEVDGLDDARAGALVDGYAAHCHRHDVMNLLRASGVGGAFASRTIGGSHADVMWLPTPPALIERMLDVAGVTAADHVIDLGAGDGALVLAAARRGARALGVESNGALVALAR